jgi:hypothetical protein
MACGGCAVCLDDRLRLGTNSNCGLRETAIGFRDSSAFPNPGTPAPKRRA